MKIKLILLIILVITSPAAIAVDVITEMKADRPTTRVDGSPLAEGDIKKYNLYKDIEGEWIHQGDFLDITSFTHTFSNPPTPEGEQIFCITAVDQYDRESECSESLVVNYEIPRINAPINLQSITTTYTFEITQ